MYKCARSGKRSHFYISVHFSIWQMSGSMRFSHNITRISLLLLLSEWMLQNIDPSGGVLNHMKIVMKKKKKDKEKFNFFSTNRNKTSLSSSKLWDGTPDYIYTYVVYIHRGGRKEQGGGEKGRAPPPLFVNVN